MPRIRNGMSIQNGQRQHLYPRFPHDPHLTLGKETVMSLKYSGIGGNAMKFPGSSIFVVVVVSLAIGTLSIEASSSERAKLEKEDASEKVLLVGVPTEFQAAFVEYLVNNRIEYRFDTKTRTFYVRTDPIPVLEGARRYEVLERIAQRGLWEREIERAFRLQWPDIENPRICVSLASYLPGEKKEESEPIAFVLAQGLSVSDAGKVKEMVVSHVPGMLVENVSVVGTDWRPGPSYEKGTKRIASVR